MGAMASTPWIPISDGFDKLLRDKHHTSLYFLGVRNNKHWPDRLVVLGPYGDKIGGGHYAYVDVYEIDNGIVLGYHPHYNILADVLDHLKNTRDIHPITSWQFNHLLTVALGPRDYLTSIGEIRL